MLESTKSEKDFRQSYQVFVCVCVCVLNDLYPGNLISILVYNYYIQIYLICKSELLKIKSGSIFFCALVGPSFLLSSVSTSKKKNRLAQASNDGCDLETHFQTM